MKSIRTIICLIYLIGTSVLYAYRLEDFGSKQTSVVTGITREFIEIRTRQPGILKLSSTAERSSFFLIQIKGEYDRKAIGFVSNYDMLYNPEKILGLKKDSDVKVRKIEEASIVNGSGFFSSLLSESVDQEHSYLIYANMSKSARTEDLTLNFTPVSFPDPRDTIEELKENDIRRFRFVNGNTVKEYDFKVQRDGYIRFVLGNVPSRLEYLYLKFIHPETKKEVFREHVECRNGEGYCARFISAGQYRLMITPNSGEEYVERSKNTVDEIFLITEFNELEDQDRCEPNDSIKTAVPLKNGEVVKISIFPEGDKDFFSFELKEGNSLVDLFTSDVPDNVYLFYTVMNRDGEKILDGKIQESDSFKLESSGKYYIQFEDVPKSSWDSKSTDPGVFNLMISSRLLGDRNEVNNSLKEATVLKGLSGTMEGTFEKNDPDYYRLQTSKGFQNLSIYITNSGISGDFELFRNSELLQKSGFKDSFICQRAVYAVPGDVYWFRLTPRGNDFQQYSYDLCYAMVPADGKSAYMPDKGERLKSGEWVTGALINRSDRDYYSFVPEYTGGYYLYFNNNYDQNGYDRNIAIELFKGNRFLLQGSNESRWSCGPTALFRDTQTRDFSIDFRFFPQDDDGLGLVFRQIDENNYYSFVMDRQQKKIAFMIMEKGRERVGKEFKDIEYLPGQWNLCSIKVKGESFELDMNGKKVTVTDSTFLEEGNVGVFSNSSENLGFDDIVLKTEKKELKFDFQNDGDFSRFDFIHGGWWDLRIEGETVLCQVTNDGKDKTGPIALVKDFSGVDFTMSFLCKTSDDDGLGAVFRYRDEKNFYVWRFDNQERKLEFIAVKDGAEKVIKEFRDVLYSINAWNIMKLETRGNDFKIHLNGKPVAEVTDTTFSGSGKAGFMCSFCDNTRFTGIRFENSGPDLTASLNKRDINQFELAKGGKWEIRYEDAFFRSGNSTGEHYVNLEKGIEYDISLKFNQRDELSECKYNLMISPADFPEGAGNKTEKASLDPLAIYSPPGSDLYVKVDFAAPGKFRLLAEKFEWKLAIPGIRLIKEADMDYPEKKILFLSGGDKGYDFPARYPEFQYTRINTGSPEEKNYLNLDFNSFDLVIIDGVNNLGQFGLNQRETYDRIRQKIEKGAKVWIFARDAAISNVLDVKLKNGWQDNKLLKVDFTEPLLHSVYPDDTGQWNGYENTGYFLEWEGKGYKALYTTRDDLKGAVTLKKELGRGFLVLDTRLLCHSGTYSTDRMIYNILGVREKYIHVRNYSDREKNRFFHNDFFIEDPGVYYINCYNLTPEHRLRLNISDNDNLLKMELPDFKKIMIKGGEESVPLAEGCAEGDRFLVYNASPAMRENFIQLISPRENSKPRKTLVLWGEDRYQQKINEFSSLNAEFINFNDCRGKFWWKDIGKYDLIVAIGINRKWHFALEEKEVQDALEKFAENGGRVVLCVTYNRESIEFDGCIFDSERSQDRVMVKNDCYSGFFGNRKVEMNNWNRSSNTGWIKKVSPAYHPLISNLAGEPVLIEKKTGKGVILLTTINFLADSNQFNEIAPFASLLFDLPEEYRFYFNAGPCGMSEFLVPADFRKVNFVVRGKGAGNFYFRHLKSRAVKKTARYVKGESEFDVSQDLVINDLTGVQVEVPCKSSLDYIFRNVPGNGYFLNLYEGFPGAEAEKPVKILYMKGNDEGRANSYKILRDNPGIALEILSWSDCGRDFFKTQLQRYQVVIMEGFNGSLDFFYTDEAIRKGIEKFASDGGTFILSSPTECKGKKVFWGDISDKITWQRGEILFTDNARKALDPFYTDFRFEWSNSENYGVFTNLPAEFEPLVVNKSDAKGVALALKKTGKGKIFVSTILFGDSYNTQTGSCVNLLCSLIGNRVPRLSFQSGNNDQDRKSGTIDFSQGRHYLSFGGSLQIKPSGNILNDTHLWYKVSDRSGGLNFRSFDVSNPERNRLYPDKWQKLEVSDNSSLYYYIDEPEDTVLDSIVYSMNKSFYYYLTVTDFDQLEGLKKKGKILYLKGGRTTLDFSSSFPGFEFDEAEFEEWQSRDLSPYTAVIVEGMNKPYFSSDNKENIARFEDYAKSGGIVFISCPNTNMDIFGVPYVSNWGNNALKVTAPEVFYLKKINDGVYPARYGYFKEYEKAGFKSALAEEKDQNNVVSVYRNAGKGYIILDSLETLRQSNNATSRWRLYNLLQVKDPVITYEKSLQLNTREEIPVNKGKRLLVKYKFTSIGGKEEIFPYFKSKSGIFKSGFSLSTLGRPFRFSPGRLFASVNNDLSTIFSLDNVKKDFGFYFLSAVGNLDSNLFVYQIPEAMKNSVDQNSNFPAGFSRSREVIRTPPLQDPAKDRKNNTFQVYSTNVITEKFSPSLYADDNGKIVYTYDTPKWDEVSGKEAQAAVHFAMNGFVKRYSGEFVFAENSWTEKEMKSDAAAGRTMQLGIRFVKDGQSISDHTMDLKNGVYKFSVDVSGCRWLDIIFTKKCDEKMTVFSRNISFEFDNGFSFSEGAFRYGKTNGKTDLVPHIKGEITKKENCTTWDNPVECSGDTIRMKLQNLPSLARNISFRSRPFELKENWQFEMEVIKDTAENISSTFFVGIDSGGGDSKLTIDKKNSNFYGPSTVMLLDNERLDSLTAGKKNFRIKATYNFEYKYLVFSIDDVPVSFSVQDCTDSCRFYFGMIQSGYWAETPNKDSGHYLVKGLKLSTTSFCDVLLHASGPGFYKVPDLGNAKGKTYVHVIRQKTGAYQIFPEFEQDRSGSSPNFIFQPSGAENFPVKGSMDILCNEVIDPTLLKVRCSGQEFNTRVISYYNGYAARIIPMKNYDSDAEIEVSYGDRKIKNYRTVLEKVDRLRFKLEMDDSFLGNGEQITVRANSALKSLEVWYCVSGESEFKKVSRLEKIDGKTYRINPDFLSEGQYYLKISGENVFGQTASQVYKGSPFTVDRTPPERPVILLSSGKGGEINVQVEFDDPEIKSVELYRYDSFINSDDKRYFIKSFSVNSENLYRDLPPSFDRDYWYGVVLTDLAGNKSKLSEIKKVYSDNTPPSGGKITKLVFSTLKGGVLKGTIESDEPKDEKKIRYALYRKVHEKETLIGLYDEKVFEIRTLQDGEHDFTVCFSDLAGNVARDGSFSAKGIVDSKGPEFTIASNPVSPYTYGNVVLTLTSNEELKNNELLVRFVPSAGQSIYLTLEQIDSRNFKSNLKIDDRFFDGRGYFEVTASDLYENDQAVIQTGRDVMIDKTGPTAGVYFKDSTDYQRVIHLAAKDYEVSVTVNEKLKSAPEVCLIDKSGKNVLSIEFKEDPGYYYSPRYTGTLRLSDRKVPEGEYSLSYKGIDVLGNEGDKLHTLNRLNLDYIAPEPPHKGSAIFREKRFIDLKYSVSSSADTYYYLVSRYLEGSDHTQSKPLKLWGDWHRDYELEGIKDKKVMYRIRAVDHAGNISEYSEPVETITDFTPPPTPGDLTVTKSGTGLKIRFRQSGEEVPFFYNLYYSPLQNNQKLTSFDQIKNGTKLKLSSVDFDFTEKVEGQIGFAVTALDNALNESGPSNLVMIEFDNKPPEIRIQPPDVNKGYNPVVRKYCWLVSDSFKIDLAISEKLKEFKATLTSLSSGKIVLMKWDGSSSASVSGLEDGVYALSISCEDFSGNVYQGDCGLNPSVVCADTTPPGIFENVSFESIQEGKINFRLKHPDMSSQDFGVKILRNKERIYSGKLQVLKSGEGFYEDRPGQDGEYSYEFYAFDGVGNLSKAVELNQVISDRSPPETAEGVTFQKRDGVVEISWKCAEQKKHTFDVYRYGFEVKDLTGILPVEKGLVKNVFRDLPDIDGEYYYYIVTVDEVGNRSEASPGLKVTFKSEIPAASIELYPPAPLNTDARITLKSSQPLAKIPELKAVFPDGHTEILKLSGNQDTYHSSIKIQQGMPSGTLKFEFKGLGKSGFTGRIINKNKEVSIDFKEPEFNITLSERPPFTPGKALRLVLHPTEALKEPPVLVFYEMGGRKENIVLSKEADQSYSGNFSISEKASEGLSFFKVEGTDLAGNKGSRINSNERISVDLTPPRQVEKVRCELLKDGKAKIYFAPSTAEQETLACFNVYIRKLSEPDFKLAGKTNSSPFNHTFNEETVYQIAITAVDLAGLESEHSRLVSARIDLTPPIAPDIEFVKVDREGVYIEGQLKYRGEDDLQEVFVMRHEGESTERIACRKSGEVYLFTDIPPASGKYSYQPYSVNLSSYQSNPGTAVVCEYNSLLPECSLKTFPAGRCGAGLIKIMLDVKGELAEDPDIIFVPPGFNPEQARAVLFNIKNVEDAKKYVSKDLTEKGYRIKLKKRGTKYYGEMNIEEGFGSGRGEFFILGNASINGKSIPVSRLSSGNFLTLDLSVPSINVLIEGDRAGKVENRYVLSRGKYTFNVVSDKDLQEVSGAHFLTPTAQKMDVSLEKQGPRHWKGEFTVGQDTPNGNYLLKMDAVDFAGNKGKIRSGEIFTVDTIKPGVVTGIRLQKMPGQRIRIYWAPPRDKNDNVFEVFRSREKLDSVEEVAPIRVLKWAIITFDDPPETGKWWYAVRNIDEAGNKGPLSHWISADVDLTPPPPPSGLKVSSHSEGVLKLEWQPPVGEEIAFYNVYIANKPIVNISSARSMNRGVTWTEIYGAPNEDGKYFFAVTSVDKSLNESQPSENAQTDYQSIEPYVEYIRILNSNHWLKEGEYEIEVKTNQPLREVPKLWFTPLDGSEIEVQLNGAGDQYFGRLNISPDLNDKAAYFRFLGFDEQGNKGTKIVSGEYFIIDKQSPPPPRNLTIAKDLKLTRGAVELHWNTPYGEVPRYYRIFRGEKPFTLESDAEYIGEVKVEYENEDNYYFRDIPPVDGEYFYRVTAFDLAKNQSPMSNVLKIHSKIDIPCFDIGLFKSDENGSDIPVFSIPGGKSFLRVKCNKPLKESPAVRFVVKDVNHLMIREKIVTRDEILASIPPSQLKMLEDLADPNKKKEIMNNVSGQEFDKLAKWKEELDGAGKRKVSEKGYIIDWTKIYKDPGTVTLSFRKKDTEGKEWESVLDVPNNWLNGEAVFSTEAVTDEGEKVEFIRSGSSFMIDTMGPKLEIRAPEVEHMDVNLNLKEEQKLVTAPLKSGWHDLIITSTETLGEIPKLGYVDSTGITREIHVKGFDRQWNGRMFIPEEAGQGPARFCYKGVDLWGNVSDELLEKRYWQDIDDTVFPPQVTANYATLGKTFDIDTIPPGIPENFEAGIIKLGVVKLEWKHPDKNGEIPAYYNVYRNYVIFTGKDPSLIVRKKNIAPVAIDAPDRDGNYFYRVAAMDLAGNEGELSELKSVFVDSIKPELKIKAVPSGDWLVIEVEAKSELPELSLTLNFPGSNRKNVVLGGESGELKRKVKPSGEVVYSFVLPERREVFDGHVNIVVHSPDPVGNQVQEEVEMESKWISEDTGGEIESADDMASFVIPPGVQPVIPKGKKEIELSDREHIFYVTYANVPREEPDEKPEYDRIRPAPMPPQLSVVGKPYTIHINVPPEEPVSMKAAFSQMEIPKLPKLSMKIPSVMVDQYSDPEFMKRKLKVIMWNPPDEEKKGNWSVCVNVELDPVNNKVIIPAEKVTSYALVTEKTPPSVTEMFPQPDSSTMDFQPKISFLIIDKGTGVAVGAENLIAVHIDGIPVSGKNIVTSKNNPTEVSVKVQLEKPLMPGKHYVSVRCEDVVENIAKVQWCFNVDNQKPEISLLFPAEKDTMPVNETEPVRAYFKISDIGGGVDKDGISLKINQIRLPAKCYSYAQYSDDQESGLLTVFPDREYIKDGENLFTVLATDIAGLKTLGRYMLKFDSTRPEISFQKLRFFDRMFICKTSSITVGVTDNAPLNKAGVTILLNGQKMDIFDYDPLKNTVTVNGLTEGYNTFTMTVLDEAGNGDYVNHSIMYVPETSLAFSSYGESGSVLHIAELPGYIPETWYSQGFFEVKVTGEAQGRPVFAPDFFLLHVKGGEELKLKIDY